MTITQTAVGYLAKILQALTNDVNAFANETVVVGPAVGTLTPPNGATKAILQLQSTVLTTAVRYWEDGTEPTAATGFSQGNGFIIEITTAENIRKFKFIEETAGTTAFVVTYYK